MAIQFRRGLFANLDKSKLVAGEPVVALDNDKDYVGIAKGANDVIELATKEALDNKVIANPSGTATGSLNKIAIDGDVYSVEGSGGGSYTKTLLWDYINDNSGVIPYKTYTLTLHDSATNYDDLLVESVSNDADISSADWNSTNQWRINVDALYNANNPHYLAYCSFADRSARYYINGTTFQCTTTNHPNGNTNGIIRIYGIKMGSSGGSGTVDSIPSFTSTNALQNAVTMSAIKWLALGTAIQDTVEIDGELATHAYSAGNAFLAIYNDNYITLNKATSAIAVGDDWTQKVVRIDTTPIAERYALDGKTNYYGAVQEIGSASTEIFYKDTHLSVVDSNGNLRVAKALKNIPSGTTITNTGNDPSVEILPAVYENVQANPSGTATSSLTKLQVGNDIYSVSGGGGGTVDSTMSETSTNALQNKTIFEQLAYYTYGGSRNIETNFTSQHAYSAGDRFYFEYSGLVRPAQALTNIAVGDTLLIDQNYKQFGALVDSIELSNLTDVDTSAISGFGHRLLQYDGVYHKWFTINSPFMDNFYSWSLFPNNTDLVHKIDLSSVCGTGHGVYISNAKSYVRYRPSHEGGGTPDYGMIPFAPHIDFSNWITDTSNVLHDLTLDFQTLLDSDTGKPYLIIKKNNAINLDYYSVDGVVGLTWDS